jgi:hypothetical protein
MTSLGLEHGTFLIAAFTLPRSPFPLFLQKFRNVSKNTLGNSGKYLFFTKTKHIQNQIEFIKVVLLQAGRRPDEVIFFNLPNPSSVTMALGVFSASNRNK